MNIPVHYKLLILLFQNIINPTSCQYEIRAELKCRNNMKNIFFKGRKKTNTGMILDISYVLLDILFTTASTRTSIRYLNCILQCKSVVYAFQYTYSSINCSRVSSNSAGSSIHSLS